ncbi:PX domain-containing protein kinase-like protein [Armadillidium nasatum]|uniref:PX domain-containing protein kinase-like protein n=1 Tax=Armadillidium nasatum TaxID=96803 RepID=A0A5N5T5W9_9CRUS|nr:PX domain-containing protein kinase-like protein [Armadillidium nasatum]
MAVFERRSEDRTVIDDTKPFLLEIKDIQNVDGHIEYKIEGCRYPDIDEKWIVSHRFRDFVNLHSSLKTPTINLPSLPPKKKYLSEILENYYVSISPQFRRFVDPVVYDGTFAEEARQHIMVALRSSGTHEISQPLPHIGTRVRKKYFLGRPLQNPKAVHTLWWAPYGPDRMKHLRDIHTSLTALLHCKHSYIVSAINCIATESGVCVVRPWFPQGSLRDYIYGVKPQFDSLLKYSNSKRREIDISICAVYGRQILEAITFLHEKGIAHGSIHTGNVVIENNVCQLLDMENQILGQPHPLRNFMIKIKKLNCLQAIDIYCFGHLLYELVFREPLMMETCDDFPKESSPLCRSVLESILSSEACKNGLPSASALLTHPFFNEVPLLSYEKPFLKLPPTVKSAIAATYEILLERLKEDQKKVKLQRQKYRAETFLSEGERVVRSNRKVTKNVKSSEDNDSGVNVSPHLNSDFPNSSA